MATLPIVTYPSDLLRQECAVVSVFDDALRTFVANMFDTMYDARGIGLAASQVGVLKQIAVIDISPDDPEDEEFEGDEDSDDLYDEEEDYEEEEDQDPALQYEGKFVIINPEISSHSGRVSSEEGCLSIPDYRDTVKRHKEVVVKGVNEFGASIEIAAGGLLAICLQHEIDHLHGVLFVDHLSRLKREIFRRRYKS